MNVLVPLRAALGAIVVMAVSSPLHARAQDASQWQNDGHSALRLLAGSRNAPVLLGGIALKLQPGWHTYWRNPGDSGVPPRFDFSRSDNVSSVTILWPAPKPFDDGAGGTSLGYLDDIVLPLRIVAKDAGQPVTLRADVNYAVCEKICVPVEAKADISFSNVASTQDETLTTALAAVPKPAKIGDAGPLGIKGLTRDGKTAVLVDVIAPEGAPVDLFVEGPTPDWSLPLPKPVDRSPADVRRFTFELDGLPPGAKAEGAALKLTLVGASGAYEFTVDLK
jgi:DsbC/DsbD-like thiol-disulfide interchange protein